MSTDSQTSRRSSRQVLVQTPGTSIWKNAWYPAFLLESFLLSQNTISCLLFLFLNVPCLCEFPFLSLGIYCLCTDFQREKPIKNDDHEIPIEMIKSLWNITKPPLKRINSRQGVDVPTGLGREAAREAVNSINLWWLKVIEHDLWIYLYMMICSDLQSTI